MFKVNVFSFAPFSLATKERYREKGGGLRVTPIAA